MFVTNLRKLSERILKQSVRSYAYDPYCMKGRKVKRFEPSLGASGESAIETETIPIKSLNVNDGIELMRKQQNLPIIRKYYRPWDKWIINRLIQYLQIIDYSSEVKIFNPKLNQGSFSSRVQTKVNKNSFKYMDYKKLDNYLWLTTLVICVPALCVYFIEQPQNKTLAISNLEKDR